MYEHVPRSAVRDIAKEKAMPDSPRMDQLETAFSDVPNSP
ncbi:Unknown protein sequence [Pseudomonas syringae pv. maculicola]|jgi:hypothetical protein|nr:Unknown protein sequence [Pseudomonas syringae pv. maculicola]KPB96209.1 Unknown protein sequence [Pseudomonas syringae pv. maculicola]KPC06442.1 Unknown protein sequence [Pseudomonas amygdali pv. lachrymans]KPC13647.1 Unknown protein sequence [Pseudomonas syringae pv. maculicola]